VKSKRGVGGGYVLAKSAEQITIGSIVRAVDGPIALGDFGQPHQNNACNHEGQCVLLSIWSDVSVLMQKRLDSYTLAEVAALTKTK
jgi:Rrf2 family iron-sulfur cluster assembly transcriptional regulator